MSAASLAPAMVPSVFVLMEELPRTLTGKVDRQALPAPAEAAAGRPSGVAARTETEQAVATIWREVLGLDEVSVEDDFFRSAATRSQPRGCSPGFVRLRRRPATADALPAADRGGLAERGGTGAGGLSRPREPPLERIPREEDHPASFAQERLWFLQRLEPESVAYNMAALVHLTGDVDIAALTRSLAAVVRRHEPLRTTLPERDGRPVQRIAPPGEVEVEWVDLTGAATPRTAAEQWTAAVAQRPFDLESGPLLRLSVLRLGAREHAVSVVIHHIVSDLWSMEVFTREVATLYEAELADRPAPLPELAVQFVDFVVWQRSWLSGDVLASELAYWRQQLSDALDPLPSPPIARARRCAGRGARSAASNSPGPSRRICRR